MQGAGLYPVSALSLRNEPRVPTQTRLLWLLQLNKLCFF